MDFSDASLHDTLKSYAKTKHNTFCFLFFFLEDQQILLIKMICDKKNLRANPMGIIDKVKFQVFYTSLVIHVSSDLALNY